jgi:hypothetical protein
MKGQGGVLDDVRIDVALHQEWVSHHPFGSSEIRSSFTPRRVELRDGDGTPVEALDDPRETFAEHSLDTPWTRLQLAYFVGTAMWTYLTQPFCLTLPGFRVEELSPWREENTDLRRLRVEWPSYLASHSTEQTLYFDQEGRLARHGYEVEIVAAAPAAHLFRPLRLRRRHHHAHPAPHPCEGRSRPHRHQQRHRRDRRRRHCVRPALISIAAHQPQRSLIVLLSFTSPNDQRKAQLHDIRDPHADEDG